MAWKRSSVRSRPGPPNLPNNLDGSCARSRDICVVTCVVTCRSGARGKGFHRVALRFHADVAVSLQHPSADVPCDCHYCRIGCAALRKLSDRAMPEIVEAETRQARLLCQSSPSRPPALDVGSRVERSDVVVDHLLAAEGEFRHESRKDVVRRLGGAEGLCSLLNRSDVRLGIDEHAEDVRVINGIVRGREMHPLLIRSVQNADDQLAGFEQLSPDHLDLWMGLSKAQKGYWELLPQEFRFEEVAERLVPRSSLSRLIARTKSFGALQQGEDGVFRKLARG